MGVDAQLVRWIADISWVTSHQLPPLLLARLLAGILGASMVYLYTEVYANRGGFRAFFSFRLLVAIFLGGLVVGFLIEPENLRGGILAGIGWETFMKRQAEGSRG